MKRYLLCLLLLCLLLWTPAEASQQPLRGVWVSTVYHLDYPSAAGLSEQQLMAEADAIIEHAADWGLNTIFLQVRPCGDALYRSALQPWSAVLSGTQGTPADGNFDPLAYFTEKCHQKGLEVHAWLNPYRLTRSAAASRQEALDLLHKEHPAHALDECIIYHTDGCLYLDPGRPEVHAHLLEVAREILENYDVDGIHLDDYFYPGADFGDDETYSLHGRDFSDIGDFRRHSVNTLVQSLHRLAEEYDRIFGVSPSGIWATAMTHPMGAETFGSQSYYEQYADSRRWVREGMVDYIAPQIYWEIGAEAGDFSLLLDWWATTVKDTNVDLYIGIAAYKSIGAADDSVWYGTDELLRQLDAVDACEEASGTILFRYGSVLQSDLAEALASRLPPEPQRPAPVWPREITISGAGSDQSVLSGHALDMGCTAYRGSRVRALYGSNWQTLTSDLNGTYRGSITAQSPHQDNTYTAPVLIGTEKHGLLFIKLSPFTVTSVEAVNTVSIENIDWQDTEAGHEIVFHTKSPAAAALTLDGDVAELCFSPCRLGVTFRDTVFDHMEVMQDDICTRYRLVYPDDGQFRQHQLIWAPDKITLVIRKIGQEPPVPDR